MDVDPLPNEAPSETMSPPPTGNASSANPRESGISLDGLSRAFAQMLQNGDDPYEETPPTEVWQYDDESALVAAKSRTGEEDEACPITPRSIVEAILFIGRPDNQPLSAARIAGLMRGVRPREVDALIAELNDIYDAQGRAYRIVSRGQGYLMQLRSELSQMRDSFYGRVKEARLSQASVDVLAVVAYHQGIAKADIDRIRGRSSGAVLGQLVRRDLLRIERNNDPCRTMRYFTTDRFLELFEIDDVKELPRSHEIDRYM